MSRLKFLVVDYYEDNRWLVVRALRTRFPTAEVLESGREDEAIQIAASKKLAAIIVHRAAGMDHGETVAVLRRISVAVPIVMISGIDRQKLAKESGANCFHLYGRWKEIGSVVADLISAEKAGFGAQNHPADGELERGTT